MSHSHQNSAVAIIAIIVLGVMLHCELPQDPNDPSNTSVNVLLRTTDWVENPQSNTDTVGNIIRIGAEINLPENIDSLRMTITSIEDTVEDTLFKNFATDIKVTLWKKIYFTTVGTKVITITPYSTLGIAPVVAFVNIVPGSGSTNIKPQIITNVSVVTGPAAPCSLIIRTSDADTAQAHKVVMTGANPDAVLQGDSLFYWTPPAGFIGYDTVTFVVTDNGKPPFSDTATSIIIVTATPHPPTISVSGNLMIRPLGTCTLTVHATDLDAGQKVLISMTEFPSNAVITNDSLFIWNAPATSVGEYKVLFTAADNGIPPLSSTSDVRIMVVASLVNAAPKWDVKTFSVPLDDTTKYTKKLTDICRDTDGDVITFTLSAGTPTGDTIIGTTYSFSAKPALIGQHSVRIIASDSKGATDTLKIDLTISSSSTADVTPPTITLVSPSKDSLIVSTPTYPIDVISSDASGIASVTATLGGTTLPLQPASGHYSATMGGLKAGEYSKIELLSTDASSAANKCPLTVYIKYSPGFTLKYDGNGNSGSTVPVDTGSYQAGAKVTVRANTGSLVKTGATFAEWNTSRAGTGTAYAPGAYFTMRSMNDTLFAMWNTDSFTITFDGQNATTPSKPISKTVAPPAKCIDVLPEAPKRSGYIFGGWYTAINGGGTEFTVATPVAANDTVYANWKSYSYTITFDGGAGVTPTIKTVNSPATTVDALPVPVKSGYDLAGWFIEDGGAVVFTTSTIVIADDTVYAKWVQKFTVSITNVPEVGGSVIKNPNAVSYNSGVTVTLTASASAGYRFKDWGMDLTGSNNPNPISMTKNYTVSANFIRQYTLTISALGNGSVTPSGNKVVDADALTDIQAGTNSGTGFFVWRVTAGQAVLGDSMSAATTVKLTQGDATVQAIFKKTTFTKTFGGTGAIGYSVFTLPQDKGFLIAGKAPGSNSCVFVRTNKFGDSLWTKTYSCAIPNLEGFVKQTIDGGFIVTGGASNKIALIKTDSAGVISWIRSLGPIQLCSGNIIQEISTGGYIIGGQRQVNDPSGTEIYLMRINSDATTVAFEKSYNYGSGATNIVTDIKQVGDNFVYYAYVDYAFAGESSLKINKISGTSGETIWDYSFQNTPYGNRSSNIYPINDGYIISGSVNGDVDNYSDAFLAKISATDPGSVVWKYLFGGVNFDDKGSVCKPTTDGGYIIAGALSVSGINDIYLIKTDASGAAAWVPPKTFGGNGDDVGYSVQQVSDGGYVLTGGGPNGMYLIKTDANGVVQ